MLGEYKIIKDCVLLIFTKSSINYKISKKHSNFKGKNTLKPHFNNIIFMFLCMNVMYNIIIDLLL